VSGKALGPNPAFMDPGHNVGLVDLNLGKIPGKSPNDANPGGPRLAQRGASRYLSSYAGDQAMDWVMDCARFTGDTVANAEYHFEKPEENSAVRLPGDPVTPPEALKALLEQPNPYMDYIEMMELLIIDLLLVGNAYWFKWKTNAVGQPIALYRLAPPYVEVATKPWGIGAYIYQIPNADKIEIEPENIIHFKLANPDPKNPFYGAGLIQGAGRAADLELALTDSQTSYMENHAMPSIAVESERRVPRDVFKKIRAQLRARAQGPKNAGELLVLEAGLKLNSVAPNAGEAGYAELSKYSRDRVFSWFRMNPKLVGLTDESSPETLREAQQHFDNKTARPLMNKLQTKLTKELTAAWNLDFCIDYEYQLSPEEQAKQAAEYGRLPGITIDEVRKVAGLGPHPDKTIGELTINLPGEEGGEGGPGAVNTENGIPDTPLPGEKGRPPRTGNTRAIPANGGKLPKGAAARRPKKPEKKAFDLADLDAMVAELEQKAIASVSNVSVGPKLNNEIRPADALSTKRTTDVDIIVSSFEADLRSASTVLERGLLDTVEGKAFTASNIVSKLRSSDAWGTFKELSNQAYEKALLRVMSTAAIHHAEIGLKPAGEIDYEKLVDELVARKKSGVAAITASYKNMLAEKVKEARTGSSTMNEIQAALQAAIADWNTNKASEIALTEATRGYNESTLAVAESAGMTHVVVSDGTDNDEACADADGKVWTLDQARENPLEHPRCRRAFVPVTVPA
jgi:HK97 family phage portal protein